MALLCKLYDMSSLPMIKNNKLYAYIALVMTASSISFYRSSIPLADMLVQLDEKYEETYKKHLKQNNFEGVVWGYWELIDIDKLQ